MNTSLIPALFLSLTILLSILSSTVKGQEKNPLDKNYPVRGLFVDAPGRKRVDDFIKFIDEELAPNHINTLILAVNYNYRFTSRPEMADPNAIGKEEAKKIVAACKKNGINVFPLINLLGHQSWSAGTGKLLQVYPDFTETPKIKAHRTEWPNPDGYYCLSYCPLHPEVHNIVLPLVDEVVADFEAEDFHAGMDEVFYLGHDSCPRCQGKDKAELFADELTRIQKHLDKSDTRLWIWGDRLLDGKKTGLGEWEASDNDTAPAVAMIPKKVVVCDWHYNRAETSAPLFAAEELDVVSCFWNVPQVASDTLEAVRLFRNVSSKKMRARYRGVLQTAWSGNDRLLRDYYDPKLDQNGKSEAASLKRMFKAMNAIVSEVNE